MRIYIDTSVINGLYGQDADIKKFTEIFFDYAQKTGAVLYSAELVVEEINHTPDKDRRNQLKEALARYNVEFLPYSDEIEKLAEVYIKRKVIPVKYFPDAVHIATASIHNIPVLVSWNFEHIVKLKTKVEISKINYECGCPKIDICSPQEA